MEISGFALVSVSDRKVLQVWVVIPNPIRLPNGDIVYGADENYATNLYKIAPTTITVPDPKVPFDAFRKRMTDDEVQALFALGNWKILDFFFCAAAEGGVVPSSPLEQRMKNYLVSEGTFTQERADVIFS